MAKAKRTDPKLWDTVKDELMASGKGGKRGEWSARKAQMAVQEYKRRGGGYAADGPEQGENDLNASSEMVEHDLPEAAIDASTDDEPARTSANKRARAVPDRMESFAPEKPPAFQKSGNFARAACGAKCPSTKKGKQVSDEPEDITLKRAKAQLDDAEAAKPEPTRKELLARAKALGIEGRARLSKAALLEKVLAAEEINARKEALTKRDLSEAAKILGIEKRSAKSKDQLRDALADALGNGAVYDCTKAELKTAAGYLDAAVKSSMTKSAIAFAARAMVV